MSGTCSLFPPFGNPWPSCLLPSHYHSEFAYTRVHWVGEPSNHLIFCHPLLLLPPIPPRIRVFSNGSTLHMRWPKYWSSSFNIHISNEHLGQISFRMDRLDLLSVQGTLKSLLQHHSSKASILWPSAFFIVQLSHPYLTTGKAIALTRWTFVSKVISLLLLLLSMNTQQLVDLFICAKALGFPHFWSWIKAISMFK